MNISVIIEFLTFKNEDYYLNALHLLIADQIYLKYLL